MLASKDRHDELRSLIVYYKTHCCVCSGPATNHVKGVVGGKRGSSRESWSGQLQAVVGCARAPSLSRCELIAIELLAEISTISAAHEVVQSLHRNWTLLRAVATNPRQRGLA